MLKDIFILLRPYQYTKNLFIFAPAFFSFQFGDSEIVFNSFWAFVSFCLIASAVYVINDCLDRDEDKKHPLKSKRPIASERISVRLALVLAFFLFSTSLSLAFFMIKGTVFPLLLYLLINIFYSFKIKHIPVFDIFIISSGFVLRLFVGSGATGIVLSQWIIIMTFLLALFLALAKRRDDVLIYMNTDQKMRKSIDGYNLKFLDISMAISASIVMMTYILWTVSPEVSERLKCHNLYLSSVFVLLGIFRYMQISFVDEKSGNPARVVLEDRLLQFIIVFWLLCFLWIIKF